MMVCAKPDSGCYLPFPTFTVINGTLGPTAVLNATFNILLVLCIVAVAYMIRTYTKG